MGRLVGLEPTTSCSTDARLVQHDFIAFLYFSSCALSGNIRLNCAIYVILPDLQKIPTTCCEN